MAYIDGMKRTRIVDIVLMVFIGGFIAYISYLINPALPSKIEAPSIENNYIPNTKYGIVIDSLVVSKDKVKRNQYLANILLNYDIDYQVIDKIARNANPVFDVRKIKSGNTYSVFQKNDSTRALQYFVYEIDPVDYVVIDLTDSINIYRGKKQTRIITKKSKGVIESSLWNAMLENGTNPFLAVELSDIYAWTIDFFGIQKGDSYRVFYEEIIVEDDTIGIGKVLAACFRHMGNEFYSFYFVTDSLGDYYDDEASSMRRTFLKAPLRYSRISSRYSHSRLHPVLKIRRPHRGVDYAAPVGTPVYSIGEGIVIEKSYEKGGGGRYLKVKHNSVYTTVYMHLSGYAEGITTGKKVKQGELIGYVGKSGLATGPHLDFRVYKNGYPVDPLKVKSPPAKPVDTAYLQEYYNLVSQYKAVLDSISM